MITTLLNRVDGIDRETIATSDVHPIPSPALEAQATGLRYHCGTPLVEYETDLDSAHQEHQLAIRDHAALITRTF